MGRNVFLIGPRACGKTSVGEALAALLGAEFVDTDHALVERVGMDIAAYVVAHGWDAFRDRETETLARVAERGGRVVGCGGGIVLRPENREVLAAGVTIYLKAEVEELVRRLKLDPLEAQRPALTGKSLADEVREVLAERGPLYEGCADHIISGPDPQTAAEMALRAIQTHS